VLGSVNTHIAGALASPQAISSQNTQTPISESPGDIGSSANWGPEVSTIKQRATERAKTWRRRFRNRRRAIGGKCDGNGVGAMEERATAMSRNGKGDDTGGCDGGKGDGNGRGRGCGGTAVEKGEGHRSLRWSHLARYKSHPCNLSTKHLSSRDHDSIQTADELTQNCLSVSAFLEDG
jgi:hypothetical protein